ncbi:peptidoglycan-binding protein [Nocardiopsis alba]|uniref:peptidoglycan-binding domain-containing protein n=1 Tax=Nocardiopsis alba TaxID=53437 RepID=UPI003808F812
MPRLQDAGLGINEVRWHADFPDVNLGLVIHATAAGNIGTRLQSTDLAASSINWDDQEGNAVSVGQWWRVELSYDGEHFQSEVFAGHATSPSRIHRWRNRDVGRTLAITGYRYRRGILLRPGDNDVERGDTEVSTMQNNLLRLGYELPQWGADGWYGQEAIDAVIAFQRDHGYAVVDGFAGPETLAGIDLALRLEQDGTGYPDPLYVSHVAVSDSGPLGPADAFQEITTTARGRLRMSGSVAYTATQGPVVSARGTLRMSGAVGGVSREARTSVTGSARATAAPVPVAREARTSGAGSAAVTASTRVSRTSGTTAHGRLVAVDGGASVRRHALTSARGRFRMRGSVAVEGGGRSAISLSYARGHISDPFEPTEDDQALVNDVTVTRAGGSEYRVTRTDGPLSALDPPLGVGRYEDSVTVNAAADVQLRDLAGWRLHLGTADEARYPVVTVDLAANPALIGIATSRDTGDSLQITEPPEWLPPEPIELMIEGTTETLGPHTWTLEFNASSGGPWLLGRVSDPEEAPGPSDAERADTAGSELSGAITATATAFPVRTTQGPSWVDSASFPNHFPLDVRAGGELMRVTGIEGEGATQTFTVARALNGIRKPHPAGTSVSLAYPAVVGL